MPPAKRTALRTKRQSSDHLFTPEEERLAWEIREERASYRDMMIESLVEHALAYAAERERNDPLHAARLSTRRRSLEQSVRHAAEAMDAIGPVTRADIAKKLEMREWLGKLCSG